MRILITGGAGFIGSTVADHYLRKGHEVWIVDDESTGSRTNLPPKARYLKASVLNRNKLKSLFSKNRFHVVNHHAAQLDVRKSVLDPVFDAKVNIIGLLNLLELCKDFKVKKIIFSSSGGTVYGECPKAAKEGFPEVPLSPYGVAKLSSEKYIRAYSALHGIDYTIFRYANVYGPRQDPFGEAGVVAIFARRFLNDKPVLIFGNGLQTRDFVYVDDVARANVQGLVKGRNQIINIGTGIKTSILNLFQVMAKEAGYTRLPVFKQARAGELNSSLLDVKKAKNELGWKPAVPLPVGLQNTLRFFSHQQFQ